jgi:hypothetical protein
LRAIEERATRERADYERSLAGGTSASVDQDEDGPSFLEAVAGVVRSLVARKRRRPPPSRRAGESGPSIADRIVRDFGITRSSDLDE